jgi:tRNA A37 threonylcarbamoyladenosine synthetase subunit TsaC/SUA5/YrdC
LEAALADLAVAPTVAIDGGTLSGASSTLVNVNLPKPKIEREGAVDADSIARVLDAA